MGYVVNYEGEFTDASLPMLALVEARFDTPMESGLGVAEGGLYAGAAFEYLGSTATDWFVENGAGKKRPNQGGADVALAVMECGRRDVSVRTSSQISIANGVGLAARVAGLGDYVGFRGFSGDLIVVKQVAGVGTILATIAGGYASPAEWELQVKGATITVLRSGVEVWSGADSALPQGTKHGFLARGVTSGQSAPAWVDLTVETR